MMAIAPATIRNAFAAHFELRASGKYAWGIPYHVRCWRMARRAFARPESFGDFCWLYEQLRRRWQVFRRATGRPWRPGKAFERLVNLESEYRQKRLSGLSTGDARGLWRVLEAMSGIKRTRAGPSVVAVSKFLHFWNPRLFIIVDRGVMWNWVFAHSWLREQIHATKRTLRAHFAGEHIGGPRYDLWTYLAILFWAGELVRQNPGIVSRFAHYVREHAGEEDVPTEVLCYEAAAVEWFLIGLVQLPPAGVVC